MFLPNRGAARVGVTPSLVGAVKGPLGGGLGGLRSGPWLSHDKFCCFMIRGMWLRV